jgi:hypothetical protein
MTHAVKPADLVRTQAESVPPPDVTIPDPPPAADESFDAAILAEIKHLSNRVGGLEKLRELIDGLIAFRR